MPQVYILAVATFVQTPLDLQGEFWLAWGWLNRNQRIHLIPDGCGGKVAGVGKDDFGGSRFYAQV